MERELSNLVEQAIAAGVSGAAIVDRDGHVIAIAGAIDPHEAKPAASFVMHEHRHPDLARRLFEGEVIAHSIEGRGIRVALAVARRRLFVVTVLEPTASTELARDLCAAVERALDAGSLDAFRPWGDGGTGGSGSGPAELSLVEWGLTVPRAKA